MSYEVLVGAVTASGFLKQPCIHKPTLAPVRLFGRRSACGNVSANLSQVHASSQNGCESSAEFLRVVVLRHEPYFTSLLCCHWVNFSRVYVRHIRRCANHCPYAVCASICVASCCCFPPWQCQVCFHIALLHLPALIIYRSHTFESCKM